MCGPPIGPSWIESDITSTCQTGRMVTPHTLPHSVEDLAASLSKQGVSGETLALIFEKVGNLLHQHANHHDDKSRADDESQPISAQEALGDLAHDFWSTGRYATVHYGNR